MSKEESTPYSFKGDNAKLVDSIKSLLALDSKGALVPNGVCGLARQLLESAVERLNVDVQPAAFEISSYGGRVEKFVVREDVATEIFDKRVAEGAEDVRVRPLYAHAEAIEGDHDGRQLEWERCENKRLREQMGEREAQLSKATTFVQGLCDAAGSQPSVATGYLHDILGVLQERSDSYGYAGPFPACPEGEVVTALEWDIFYPSGISSSKPDQLVWIGMEYLPEHEVGARYRIILDDVQQACTELEKEEGKRWFRGDDSGTFPIDEIQAWLPIDEPANKESAQ
jgi:hypothetical protein